MENDGEEKRHSKAKRNEREREQDRIYRNEGEWTPEVYTPHCSQVPADSTLHRCFPVLSFFLLLFADVQHSSNQLSQIQCRYRLLFKPGISSDHPNQLTQMKLKRYRVKKRTRAARKCLTGGKGMDTVFRGTSRY